MHMNAQEKGHEAGFATYLSYAKISKVSFQKIAEHAARRAYKTQQKQQEFLEGWMENWHEPHAKDCTCRDCKDIQDILTY
jgi:hypothetical protein